MKHKGKYIAMILVIILSLSIVSVAVSAASYYEKPSGSISINVTNRANVLYYKNPHGNFQLGVWETRYLLGFFDNRYSISMYDSAGRCVWSAYNQSSRIYTVGGNVVKIVIRTNSNIGVTLNWRRY